MNSGFWEKLQKPIYCLAPMADVTDAAFRHLITKYSNIPHVTWTEFVSADGLIRAPDPPAGGGRKKLLKDLQYSGGEHPIVAQFFTSKPEMMEGAARLALELGFDGVDINMGCPDRSVEKQGAGAALIKNQKLAREIVAAAKRGVEGKIPVSVKTRLGYNKDELEEWLPELLEENPVAITIHARTRKEMSKVPARWERIKRAVEIRDKLGSKTLIFGNGDAVGIDDGRKKCEETGCDGVMLGRAIFGNPWLFSTHVPDTKERLEALIEHTNLFEREFSGMKSFSIMKKHYKAYVRDFDGSHELRMQLMEATNASEVEMLIKAFLNRS